MQEKAYYHKLYALQDQLMNIILMQDVHFYLTGGTALGRYYLNHRFSDDLDFFVNQAADFKKQTERAVSAIRKSELQIDIGTTSESFLRVNILKDDITIKIDFVNDVIYHYGEFEAADFFPRIDSWRNILSNKLCAISRSEPKDIADLLFISKTYLFEWPEIFEEAKNKDLWVDPLVVSQIIHDFPITLLDTVKWMKPIDQEQLANNLNQMHDDIFYGQSNSLVGLS